MTEINYDELIFKLNEQRNNLLCLAHSGKIDEETFKAVNKSLKELEVFWDLQKAIEFVHKHTCNACLEEAIHTFPEYDYRLCFDCCAIIIGEHLQDWCKIKNVKEIIQ